MLFCFGFFVLATEEKGKTFFTATSLSFIFLGFAKSNHFHLISLNSQVFSSYLGYILIQIG